MKFFQKRKELFPGQQQNEKICLVTRQHWVVLAGRLLVWGLFLAFYFLLDSFVLPAFPEAASAPYEQIISAFKSIYFLTLITSLLPIITIYYLNVQVITNERVVDMDQKGLLYHRVSELNLRTMEDVSAEINGFFGNVFNYGTVFVRTAAEKTDVDLDNIPNPQIVAKLILDLFEQLPEHKKVIERHK